MKDQFRISLKQFDPTHCRTTIAQTATKDCHVFLKKRIKINNSKKEGTYANEEWYRRVQQHE
jgi:hypothetical protein